MLNRRVRPITSYFYIYLLLLLLLYHYRRAAVTHEFEESKLSRLHIRGMKYNTYKLYTFTHFLLLLLLYYTTPHV